MKFAAVILGIVLAVGALKFVAAKLPRRAVAIDSFVLSEPWRRSVAATQSSQRRYGEIVQTTRPGPLHDRLEAIRRQVERGVEECWQVAKRGDELDATLSRLRPASLQRQRAAATDAVTRESLDRQLASVERMRASRDSVDLQLRQLTTRMEELVAQAAEISASGTMADDLGSAVDDVVTQLEALRLAVDDVESPGDGSTGQTQPAL